MGVRRVKGEEKRVWWHGTLHAWAYRIAPYASFDTLLVEDTDRGGAPCESYS